MGLGLLMDGVHPRVVCFTGMRRGVEVFLEVRVDFDANVLFKDGDTRLVATTASLRPRIQADWAVIAVRVRARVSHGVHDAHSTKYCPELHSSLLCSIGMRTDGMQQLQDGVAERESIWVLFALFRLELA